LKAEFARAAVFAGLTVAGLQVQDAPRCVPL